MVFGLVQAIIVDEAMIPEPEAPTPAQQAAAAERAAKARADAIAEQAKNFPGPSSANTNAPPAADNPNNPNQTTSPETGADANQAAAAAAFNRQMFILDKFAFQPAMFTGQSHSNAAIPIEVPFETINEILSTQGDGINNWINKITPKEYAQLVPKINLSLVNLESESQTDIPLSEASNVRGGLASEDYFTNKTVGLKSFEMNIDGNTTPVTGKIYNISLVLLFDSVNTFFGNIPNMPGGMSYADIFRRQGAVGGEANTHKMKLSIEYSASPGAIAEDGTSLVNKYSLDSGMAFVTYLTLIKTKMILKENLQTEVRIEYQGYEEGLLKNELLFDFLRLDLDQTRRDRQDALSAVRGTRDREISDAQRDFDAAQQAVTDNKAGMEERAHSALLQAASIDGEDRRGEAGQRGQAVLKQLAASGLITSDRAAEVWSTEWDNGYRDSYTSLVNTLAPGPNPNNETILQRYVKETLVPGVINGSVSLDRPEGYNRLSGAGAGTVYDFKDLLDDSIQANANNLNNAAESLREARAAFQTARDKANAGLETNQKEIEDKFQHARMSQIRESLNSMLFSKKEVFHTVKINSAEMQAYLLNLRQNTQKNYFENPANNGTSNPSTGRSTTDPTNTPTVPTSPGGAGSGTAASEQAAAELTARATALEREVAQLQRGRTKVIETARDVAQSAAGQLLEGAANAVRDEALAALDRDIERKQGEINSATEERRKLNQNLSTIGSIPDLERRLTNFEEITYIYFGDLLGLVMTRLQEIATSQKAKMHYNRIRFLLTKIILPNISGTNVTRRIYNMPIDLAQLQKLFADRLYGTQKSTFTLLELARAVINFVTLSQQRKARLLGKANSALTYAISIMPYPLDSAGKLAKSPNQEAILHGMIFRIRDTTQTLQGADGTQAGNIRSKIPHFFLGGAPRGAVRAIDIEEIQDSDLQKVAFRRLTGGSDVGTGILPAMFSTKIKLYGSPFLHMGMFFYLGAPTINIGNSSTWFFLDGYYVVKSLTHSYSAGGQYVTEIEGLIQTTKAQAAAGAKAVELMTAVAAESEAAIAAAAAVASAATEAAASAAAGLGDIVDTALNDFKNLVGSGNE